MKKEIQTYKIERYYGKSGEKMHVLDLHSFLDFADKYSKGTQSSPTDLQRIKELKISGCTIDDFTFLQTMPNLERLYLLACNSDVWYTLSGTPGIRSLGLHNLKHGKKYLDSVSFLSTFPQLEYLLCILLGVHSMSEITQLQSLHTVFYSCRDENNIKLEPDFSPFCDVKNLKVFDGWTAVDRQRIPADALKPIIKNPSLESFTFSQMFVAEEKRILQLIREYHPALEQNSLTHNQLMVLRGEFCD